MLLNQYLDFPNVGQPALKIPTVNIKYLKIYRLVERPVQLIAASQN